MCKPYKTDRRCAHRWAKKQERIMKMNEAEQKSDLDY
jgi:hypothetical protein